MHSRHFKIKIKKTIKSTMLWQKNDKNTCELATLIH